MDKQQRLQPQPPLADASHAGDIDAPASPRRRAVLGGITASGALALLPAGSAHAAPRAFTDRRWSAEPVPAGEAVILDFTPNDHFETSFNHRSMDTASAYLHSTGHAVVNFNVIDLFDPGQPGYTPGVGAPRFVWRPTPTAAWVQADGGHAGQFTPTGDLVALAGSSSEADHGFTLDYYSGSGFHFDDGTSDSITSGSWPTGLPHTQTLMRRNGDVVGAFRRGDWTGDNPVSAPYAITFFRRDARRRVWSQRIELIAPGSPRYLFEEPSGALILIGESPSGLLRYRQAPAGGAWSSPVPFPVPVGFGADQSAIVMDDYGTLHLLWIAGTYPELTVYCTRITPDGVLERALALQTGNVFGIGLQTLAGGQVALSWNSPSGTHVLYRLPGGSFLTAPIFRPPASALGGNALAMDRAGNQLAVWSDDNPALDFLDPRYLTADYAPSHIWAQTRPRGGVWQAPRRIDGSSSAPRRRVKPVIGMADDGSAIVAWVGAQLSTDSSQTVPAEARHINRQLETQTFS